MLKLYSYFRSSAAYRVRIALNLKQVDYKLDSVHLTKNGGQQNQPDYVALNPQKLVPCLIDNGQVFTQSMAILEYLEEKIPHPALLPRDLAMRAKIRAFAQAIVSDIHPLNNLRVLNYLKQNLQMDDEKKNAWYEYWIIAGLQALETLLPKNETAFCFGEQPSFADICLIPQLYNAKRFNISLNAFPKLLNINQHCLTQPAFIKAIPENQPDAE